MKQKLEAVSEHCLCQQRVVRFRRPLPVVRRARPVRDDDIDLLSRHRRRAVLRLRDVHYGAHSLRQLVVREIAS